MHLRGVGNAGARSGPRGDLVVLFEVDDDERFERDGEDLYTEVLLTFPQAVRGADVEVAGIAGPIMLHIPPGTQSGQVFQLRGRGLPRVNASGTGDLHVRVQVWTPTDLTADEKRVIDELAKVHSPVPLARSKGFLGEDEGSARRVTDSPWWTRVAVRPSHVNTRDRVSAAMFEAGAQGVHEAGDLLVTHLESPVDSTAIAYAVHAVDPQATIETHAIPTVDWSVAWRDLIHAHEVGRLTVAPPWLAEGMDPARTVIIEPAMAFGTGEHPTTRGVMRLMQRVVREGDVVADLGAGSAVLAIAAAKLGASSCRSGGDGPGRDLERRGEHRAKWRRGDRVKVIEGDAALLLPLLAPGASGAREHHLVGAHRAAPDHRALAHERRSRHLEWHSRRGARKDAHAVRGRRVARDTGRRRGAVVVRGDREESLMALATFALTTWRRS